MAAHTLPTPGFQMQHSSPATPPRRSSAPQRRPSTNTSSKGKKSPSPPPINTASEPARPAAGNPPASQNNNKFTGSKNPTSTAAPISSPTAANASINTPPTPPSAATVAVNARKWPAKLTKKDTASSKDNADDSSAKALSLNTMQPSASSAQSAAVSSPTNNPGVDPLSQHIFARTNTESSISAKPRARSTAPAISESLAPAAEPIPGTSTDLAGRQSTTSADAVKDREKKKGGSFLSRLGIRKTKTDLDSIADDESEISTEPRMNGADARVFSNIVDAGGFIPQHKEPPRYIRVRAHNKKTQDREFNRMFLAQELIGTHPSLEEDGDQTDDKVPVVTVSVAGAGGRRRERTGGAIWATEFSKDGKYLAAAGKDAVVRVWSVIATEEERRAQEEQEAAICPVGERLSAPVFVERPVREFEGHQNEILDLSWSKNNFLLSTGMDKTVRLWHLSREECLCTFKHKDVVTKIAFHPTDDRFFLAGSLDMTLRLWSIPDKAVAFSVQLPDLITAVSFTPDGKLAIAGLLNGVVMIYETEGLKFTSQIHAKSSRGKNSKGSKITGIRTMEMPLTSGGSNGTAPGECKLLVSTNDSRLRVYNLRDGSLDAKFKGHENLCTQISASFSDDAQYIISGSENRKTFVWKMGSCAAGDKDKQPCESFDAHGDIVTTALFAPTKTKQLLSASGDPIYDLCNPPPVVLMSAEEAAASASASQAALSEAGSQDPAQPGLDKPPATPGLPKKAAAEYSPAYIARTAHPNGNIIVTTDDQGVIKVFRQDCASSKRRHDSWETASSLSRKHCAILGPGIDRSSSIRTRTSTGSTAHSRRGSLSMGPGGGGGGGGVALVPPGTPKISSDMILSWRQNVEGGRPLSVAGSMAAPTRSERSISPAKAARTPATGSRANLAADARKQQYAATSPRHHPVSATMMNDVPDSPTSSGVASPTRPTRSKTNESKLERKSQLQMATKAADQSQEKAKQRRAPSKDDKDKVRTEDGAMSPPAPSFSFKAAEDGSDELKAEGTGGAGASYGFWNLNRWKGLAGLKSPANEGKAGDDRKHQRTNSEAVLAAAEHPEADDGPRRKSVGSSFVSGLSSPISEAHDSNASTCAKRRSAGSQAGTGGQLSRLSTVTNNDADSAKHLAEPSRPYQDRADSVVSMLSSEPTSDSEGAGTRRRRVGASGDGQQTPCNACGAVKVRTKKVQGRLRMVCGGCGSMHGG